MNEIFKDFIKIADKNKYNIISIAPLEEDDDDDLFEEAAEKLKELFNFKGKIDLFYIMTVEGNIILAFPVIENIIRENLMIKIEEY